MIYQLSSRYQKEIALCILSIFFISGIGEVKAQFVNNNRHGNGQYAYSYDSKKYARPFVSADANAVQPFDLRTLTGDDEKDKGKKAKELKSTQQNFSGKQTRKFDKADIGGPSQPEMTGFKSVGSDNMVSPFTGDFSYNAPLLDVGGYPINMFYNSGITMDQEASWVGLGWNINPGTITRNMR